MLRHSKNSTKAIPKELRAWIIGVGNRPAVPLGARPNRFQGRSNDSGASPIDCNDRSEQGIDRNRV